LLYYKGNADLNSSRIIAVVGTRNNDEYGKSICEKCIADLVNEDVIIVSGLAFGIDSIAHKASIKNNLKTIGVLAHGLDRGLSGPKYFSGKTNGFLRWIAPVLRTF
jgi:DNA processing protein